MSGNMIYGPVPSRRLGRSLGVDLVPYKTCSYDCVYCQIGRTPRTTLVRRPYVPADEVVAAVLERLQSGVRPDFITLGGSGEPTLNSDIGEIIIRLNASTKIPVAVLTNGSLLMLPEVRTELREAGVVLPSFDACCPEMFQRINRPCAEVDFNHMAEGLIRFRDEYSGQLWLEVFLVEGMNTTDEDLAGFRTWLDRIRPDKIHLNTAVRPTAESGIRRPRDRQLLRAREIMGERAEIVVPFQGDLSETGDLEIKKELLALLSRRPCTLQDMADGLNVNRQEIIKYLEPLIRENEIEQVRVDDRSYYQKKHDVVD